MTTDAKLVRKIVRYVDNKPVQIYRHYSGRFMFGSQCIGFYGGFDECAAVAKKIQSKTGKSYRTDSLGLDYIYYFPSILDPSI
jgi:hypothetical protein